MTNWYIIRAGIHSGICCYKKTIHSTSSQTTSHQPGMNYFLITAWLSWVILDNPWYGVITWWMSSNTDYLTHVVLNAHLLYYVEFKISVEFNTNISNKLRVLNWHLQYSVELTSTVFSQIQLDYMFLFCYIWCSGTGGQGLLVTCTLMFFPRDPRCTQWAAWSIPPPTTSQLMPLTRWERATTLIMVQYSPSPLWVSIELSHGLILHFPIESGWNSLQQSWFS